jgi:hypothetical protein
MTDKTIAALEAKIKILENEVRTLKNIEAINRLQKAYGYYLEHWMAPEIIDLFSDGPDVSLTLGAGTYLGKDGVNRYFRSVNPGPEFLHQTMQLAGIVNVDPDGNTANGRWYGWGAVATPSDKGMRQHFFSGIYECEYIKENAVWKFQKMKFEQFYSATPKEGWVKPELLAPFNPTALSKCKPDIPRTINPRYPSGYIVPFRFKHPVTGKKTTEEKRKSSLIP